MENSSMKIGVMTVFAVSGSMVLLIHQVHKHMLKNFMEKFEVEICGYTPHDEHKSLDESPKKHQIKKKVRFAEYVLVFPIEKTQHIMKDDKVLVGERVQKCGCQELKDIMPYTNNMYRGILKHRN
ncbi:uncharacterized protein LOC130963601 [Arachis stenosperma]|uniref:uncharacterized protein LOC130963601 n=1 Tax=Arachis stenosperma TaxID=217475 RepID=UPI0025ACA23D|nr:uncharacterized protein LOC130963601 [Arachis stenosperma]